MFTWHDIPDENPYRAEFFGALDAQDREELCEDILKRMQKYQDSLNFGQLTNEERASYERIYKKMKHTRWEIQDLNR